MDKRLTQEETLILPDRFITATFDEKTNQNILELMTEYLVNLEKYENEGLGPALFGPAGIGKTHAVAALAKRLVFKGKKVHWASTVQELNDIVDFRDYKSQVYFSRKKKLKETEFVIFDDFGQLRDFPRIRELFFEIIDYRYTWKKPTIFTATFPGEGWENVASCFNASLTRRIKDMAKGLVYWGF